MMEFVGIDESSRPENYQCDNCNLIFISQETLEDHFQEFHEKVFDKLDRLNVQLTRIKNVKQENFIEEETKVFETKDFPKEDIKLFDKFALAKCQYCGEDFYGHIGKKNVHVQTVHGLRKRNFLKHKQSAQAFFDSESPG